MDGGNGQEESKKADRIMSLQAKILFLETRVEDLEGKMAAKFPGDMQAAVNEIAKLRKDLSLQKSVSAAYEASADMICDELEAVTIKHDELKVKHDEVSARLKDLEERTQGTQAAAKDDKSDRTD